MTESRLDDPTAVRTVAPELLRAPFEDDAHVVVERGHVAAALQAFLDGALSRDDLRDWAEALEVSPEAAWADDAGSLRLVPSPSGACGGAPDLA